MLLFNVRNLRQTDHDPVLLIRLDVLVADMRIVTVSFASAMIGLLSKASFLVAFDVLFAGWTTMRLIVLLYWVAICIT